MNTTIERETKTKEEVVTEPKPDPVKEPADKASDEVAVQLAALQEDLGRTRRLLEAAKRERDLQRVLMEAGAVDLDAGLMLLSAAVEKDGGVDALDDAARARRIERAIRELVRTKPGMFRPLPGSLYAASRGRGSGGVTATGLARFDEEEGDASLKQAARAAALTGDRRTLMDYLRLRRVPAAS